MKAEGGSFGRGDCITVSKTKMNYGDGHLSDVDFIVIFKLGGASPLLSETGWPVGQSLARRWPVPCVAAIRG